MSEARNRAEFWVVTVWRLLVRIATLVALGYIGYRLRYVAVTVTLAVVLALTLEPLVERFLVFIPKQLFNRYTRRVIATLIIFLGIITLVIVLNMILIHPFEQEMDRVSNQLPLYAKSIDDYASKFSNWYGKLPIDVQEILRKQDLSTVAKGFGTGFGKLMKSTTLWFSRIVELILIPVLAFYFVLDYRSLKREFAFLVPRSRRREALYILHEVAEITQSYVIGQLILCIIAGVVVGLGLHALGMNYALTLGVFAGITRAIPILGPIVGGIPIVLLATLQSWKTGFWVLIFFSGLHLFESKFLMPKFIGYRMHLHAAVVIIVLLIGSEFFGVFGMFLAAPVAAIIRVIINLYLIEPEKRKRKRLKLKQNQSEATKSLVGKEPVH